MVGISLALFVYAASPVKQEDKFTEFYNHSDIYIEAVKNPLSFKESLKQYTREQAVILGVSPDLAFCLINAESGWRYTAKNRYSSAYGLGQFLNSTWYRTEQRMDVELDRYNPYDQLDAFLWLLKTDGYRHWIVWPMCT